jgi:hypothetical protein
MDIQDNNQNNPKEQQPTVDQDQKMTSIPKRVLLAITLGIIMLILIGVFVWLYTNKQELGERHNNNGENGRTEIPLAQQDDDFNVPVLQFTDSELGITFDYPKAWGETTTSVKADDWSLTKKISFTDQSDLYFEIVSPALRSNAQDLQKPSGFTTDLSRYCKQNILGDRSEPLSDIYDMYRLNGSDEFGVCPSDEENIVAIVHRTDKSVDPGTPPHNEVVLKQDLDKESGFTTLTFSKRYYIEVKNPLYNSLVVYQDGIPDVKSQNYCYSRWSTQADPTGYLKTYKCISHKDKPLIDKAFDDFANSEFNRQTELVLRGMKIDNVSIANAQKDFVNHFEDLVNYQSARYSYLYPKILVPNRWDRETEFNAVEIVTRESVVQAEKELESCEGPCFPPVLTSLGWDNERDLLKSNPPDGTIDCVDGINGRSLCEIRTYDDNKLLVRYTGRGGGESVVWKKHIIYKDDIRYELTSPTLGGQGTDPILFKSIEDQFIQKIYDDIVKSFTLP